MIGDWRLWVAIALIGFWLWRVVVTPVEIGLALFATSAVLLAAGFLVASAVARANRGGDPRGGGRSAEA